MENLNIQFLGENTPSLNLARKIFQGTATEKERAFYMTNYASVAEKRLGKPIGEMSIEEFTRFKALSENLSYGDLSGFNCPHCKNKGYFVEIKNGYTFHRECECMEKRRSNEDIKNSEYITYITSKTFTNFELLDDNHKHALKKAKDFIRQSKYPFFYVGGGTGTGKSHLTVATFYQLVQQGFVGEFVKWESEFNNIKSCQFENPFEFRKIMNKLKYTPLVLFDDFLWNSDGKEPTAFEYKIAKEILDERALRGLKTIFSSNYTFDKLFNLNPVVGGRVTEFCGHKDDKNGAFAVNLEGKNYRIKEGAQLVLVDEILNF